MTSRSESPLAFLFRPPHAMFWLPAFAAAAIGDPVAGQALAPFLGPENEPIQGGRRARVPGEEHFARTWAVIKPGFLRTGAPGYTDHTREDHRRTKIPGKLLALPIQWMQVMLAKTVIDLGRQQLVPAIWRAGEHFARDIDADLKVVKMPPGRARESMGGYFSEVTIIREQGTAFWRAMDRGPVRRDLGGIAGRVATQAVSASLRRHLPVKFAAQYNAYRP